MQNKSFCNSFEKKKQGDAIYGLCLCHHITFYEKKIASSFFPRLSFFTVEYKIGDLIGFTEIVKTGEANFRKVNGKHFSKL